jgi:hypothetical protein
VTLVLTARRPRDPVPRCGDAPVIAPPRRVAPGPRAIALAAALATCAALTPLAGAPGISRDEAGVIETAGRGRFAAPLASVPTDLAPPAPPLAAQAATLAHGLFSGLGVSPVRAWRLGTVAFAAVLSALLALGGHALAGAAGAVLAPLLFWLVPRHLHAGLVATPDLAAAALWLATAWAYRGAARAAGAAAQRGMAVAAGLLFGAALAARADAWILLAALALHAMFAPLLSRASRPVEATDRHEVATVVRSRGGLLALAAMGLLGPAILVAVWPWLWADLPGRLSAALAPGRAPAAGAWDFLGAPLAGRPPAGYAVAVTALTLPAAILWTYAGGLLHALAHAAHAARARVANVRDDLLLLLAAAGPFAASALGLGPVAAGVRPWLPAMPFLALLGARALVSAASAAWPARRAPLVAAVSVLVLWPALRQTAHAFPAGAAAWGELAGGTPGAASLGLQRQDGGEAAAAILEDVNARAPHGARIWWPRTAREAVRAWARDGRLRPDLAWAEGPEGADLAIVALDGSSRDDEYRAWAALRTARASAGVYLDEVPLVLVYARNGAWR